MSLAAKGLIGIGIATAAPATVFISSNSSGTSKKQNFQPTTLTNYREASYNGKYASFLGKLFVDPAEANKEWWGKSFSRLSKEKTNASSKFASATEAWGSGTTSLNKICESLYQATYSEINTTSTNNKRTNLEDFWKYCTVLESKPELVTTSTSTSTIEGKHKAILIKADKDKNTKFWEIQNEAFFADTNGLGTVAKASSSFHTLYSKKGDTSRKTLRETCLEAYKKTANAPEDSDAALFCSISTQQTSQEN